MSTAAESPASPGPAVAAADKASPLPNRPQRGVSVFPAARISRIIKADRDVDICSKEAAFLISVATEIFIKKLTDDAYTNAKLDKRKHIFYKDLSRAVQQTEYLEFLKDAIPTPIALSSALEARQGKMVQKQNEENMILEGTLEDEEEEEEGDDDEDDAEEEEQEDGEEAADADGTRIAAETAGSRPAPSKKRTHASKPNEQPSKPDNAEDGDQGMEQDVA